MKRKAFGENIGPLNFITRRMQVHKAIA